MLTELSKHINTHWPFLKEKKIGIAISGGVDSVVLTHALHQLEFSVVLAHCNFKLRGVDSDADEAFVKQLAKQLDISVFTIAFDTKTFAKQEKLSIQLAARKLRYDWFEKLIASEKFDYILTAHHTDDSLETFLINTIRGTGLDGLTGIPEQNGTIIRPLLPFTRATIESYATNNAISWQEDLSNVETKYLRNKIRHKVIPILKEINPSLLQSFQKTQEHLKESKQLINDYIENSKETFITHKEAGVQKINIEQLQKLNNPKAYLYELLKKYGFTEWDDITDLLTAQSGKQLFSETHRLLKDRDFLLLKRRELREESKELITINENESFFKNSEITLLFSKIQDTRRKIQDAGSKTQDARHKTQDFILVDKKKLKYPLTVRKWKNGDYFYPLGMQGKKKLSKFFKDEKLSLLEKEKIWLLCSENNIVWIIGKRLDKRYKITDNTTHSLKIEIL